MYVRNSILRFLSKVFYDILFYFIFFQFSSSSSTSISSLFSKKKKT